MGVRETEFIGDVEVVSVQENKYEYKRTPRAAIGLEKRREEESDDDDDVYVSKKSSESHKPSGGKEGEGEGELHVAGEEEGAAVTTNGKQNGVAEASPPAVAPKSGGEVATYIRLAEKEAEEDKNDAEAAEEKVEEEDARRDVSPTSFSLPWEVSCSKIYSPLLRLHQEIIEFTEFLQPTESEEEMRSAAISRVKGVILSLWPHSQVKVFGSYETGLYLPTSDIDLVVFNTNCINLASGLRKVANHMMRHGMAKNLLVLSKARIPIVKFEDVETGLNFDISFEIQGGPEAALFIKDMITKLPQIKPLVMILKIFLQQRELNEVYSGGIGSYALIIMVSVFLMTHEKRLGRAEQIEKCLGILLVDFFDLYGNILNMHEVGISCRKGGFFYNKEDYGFHSVERPWLLSIEDPRDTESDIGKNSFNIQKVRSAFQFAHTWLTSPEAEVGEMFLMRIIRMDGVLVKRLEKKTSVGYSNAKQQVRQSTSQLDSGGKNQNLASNVNATSLTPKEKMEIMGVTTVSISSESEEGEISESEEGNGDQSSKRRKVIVLD